MTPTLSVSGWVAIELVGDHLWQSTFCLAGAALLAWMLRHHRAQVRHWLWLAASVKFLVPFAALVAVGRQLGWMLPATTMPSQTPFVLDAVAAIGTPFSSQQLFPVAGSSPTPASLTPAATVSMLLLAIWSCGTGAMLLRWWARYRRIAMVARAATPVRDGRAWVALRRLEARQGITRPIPLVLSDAPLEPGVFGILRPVLLWPRSIARRLGPNQVQAIVAHELAHVRRHDNLAAALHMVVEAVFWFYPLVWWVGGRLVDERERACDEAVLGLGTEPGAYAESILKTCRFYVESPPACMAGVTGSDLEKRIEDIMTNERVKVLTVGRKLLLTLVAITAIGGPIAIGVLSTPRLVAQTVPGIIHQGSVQTERLPDNQGYLAGTAEIDGGIWQIHANEAQLDNDKARESASKRLARGTAPTLVLAPLPSEGQTSDQLASCAVLENDIARLQCYDALMKSVGSTVPSGRDQATAEHPQSNGVTQIMDRLAELEADKARLSPPFGPRHPEILKINAAIERVRDQLAAVRPEIMDRLAELEADKARLSPPFGPRHPEILKINAAIERVRDQLAAVRARLP